MNTLSPPSPSPHVPLSHQLAETIEEDIVTQRLPPGSKLDEVMLANRFQVSRTPIREALIQLASGGFVELRPRRGAIVTRADPHRLLEMFEVMAELEAYCGRLAARRANSGERQALLTAHVACEAASHAGDPDRYFYLNEHFHQTLYKLSHNSFLEEQARQLQKRLRPYRRLQLRVRRRTEQSYQEHQSIVEAIVSGNEDMAAQAIRAHIRIQGERFADLMASLQGG